MAKYGITLDEAMWTLPMAVVNQFIIYDELATGRKPRWHTDGKAGAQDLDALLADALTAAG